jgi:2'-5' RNA ligase
MREYSLSIKPPADTEKFIGNIKKQVYVKYNNGNAIFPAARISLIKFIMFKGYERYLLSRLFGFIIESIPFDIQINNFGLFPRHTLYLNIAENEKLRKLQQGLSIFLSNTISIVHSNISKSGKFYLTIAPNLTPDQFKKISSEYKNKNIKTGFYANNVILFKRTYSENNSINCKWVWCNSFMMCN